MGTLTKYLIYRGDRPSASAIALRDSLREVGLLANVNSLGQTRSYRRAVINWGTTNLDLRANRKIYNSPDKVADAVNKLTALTILKDEGVRVPAFSTHIDNLVRTDSIVLARTNLRGSGGAGIVVLRDSDSVVEAPLYVQYVPKVEEYRIHVVRGEIIFIQQKKKRNGVELTKDQKLIRNHDNGWVFCPVTDGRPCGGDLAVTALATLGLDFGAVDLIIGKNDRLAYILEVNTAPGLESPQLLAAYANKFKELAGEQLSSRR